MNIKKVVRDVYDLFHSLTNEVKTANSKYNGQKSTREMQHGISPVVKTKCVIKMIYDAWGFSGYVFDMGASLPGIMDYSLRISYRDMTYIGGQGIIIKRAKYTLAKSLLVPLRQNDSPLNYFFQSYLLSWIRIDVGREIGKPFHMTR